jgi:hypothetical protein
MTSKNPPALLPNPQIIKELAQAGLTPELLAQIITEDHKGNQKFATVNSVMGGLGFITVVVGFIYLIMNGHDYSAGILLGVETLAIIRLMLQNRM